MNLLFKPDVKKKSVVCVAVILLLMIGMTIQNNVTTAQASPDDGAAIRFNDKFLDAYITDSGKAWVVGHLGKIIYSDNFGKDWKVQNSGTAKGLFGVYFVSGTKGWIVGELGTILHTEDGGETWSPQVSGTGEQHLMMVEFLDENTGWAVGTRGYMIRTEDGGKNWRRLPFDDDVTILALEMLR